jgi:beta-lactamase class A
MVQPPPPLSAKRNASAVYVLNADNSLSTVYENNPTQIHPAASHIKLILAARAAEMVQDGSLKLQSEVTITHGMVSDDPSNAGFAKPIEAGGKVRVDSAITRMLQYSSNTDTNVLIHAMYGRFFDEGVKKHPKDAVQAEQYAFDSITKDLQEHGYKHSQLKNYLNLREGHRSERWEKAKNTNASNVSDIALAMQHLYADNKNPVNMLAKSALGHAKEKCDSHSLGEKVSGTELVAAHAGAWQKNGKTYISVGFIDQNGLGDLESFKPFTQQACSVIAAAEEQKVAKNDSTPIAEEKPTLPAASVAVVPPSTVPTAEAPKESGNWWDGIIKAVMGFWQMIGTAISRFFGVNKQPESGVVASIPAVDTVTQSEPATPSLPQPQLVPTHIPKKATPTQAVLSK